MGMIFLKNRTLQNNFSRENLMSKKSDAMPMARNYGNDYSTSLLICISSMRQIREYDRSFAQLLVAEHKAMLHGAIFLATCNAILLLRDVN
jgi:hypothetical protein